MAKSRKERKESMKTNAFAKIINQLTGKMYQNTYYSQPTTLDNINAIRTDIDDTIQRISKSNIELNGESSISKLYTRLYNSQKLKNKEVIKSFEDMLADQGFMNGIMTSYSENRWIRDIDNEIDITCTYMPRLLEALAVKKDNVLCSDHFSKDFLNIKNESNIAEDPSFNSRIRELKDIYNISELTEEIYERTSKYGEAFVYILPYKRGLEKMVNNDSIKASYYTENNRVISEGFVSELNVDESDIPSVSGLNLKIEINQTGILSESVMLYGNAKRKRHAISEAAKNALSEKIIADDISIDGLEDEAQDGLIDINKAKKQQPAIADSITGSIIKILPRESVIPIEIEGLVMGYYYMEFSLDEQEFNDRIRATEIMGARNANKTMADSNMVERDKLLGQISKNLAEFIDAKFINSNQDLKKEIYMILKHNEVFNGPSRLRVTFIPPEYMEHVYFKKDPRTHRGISDLNRALLPAKIYAALYITNSIAIMTRGQDKRVYYVKQFVDTNISKTLLNTINQIKKGNFGARQLDNLNNILNITGRFNDYVIPVGPSGDAPITFEVMQGQNIDVKTDFMNMLEEMAINNTDVSLEIIQARQSIDYASQLTMSSTKFLRMVYNRQAKYAPFVGRIITKLYQNEYQSLDILSAAFPPPMFLNITNTSAMIENVRNFNTQIVEIELAGEDNDRLKNLMIKKLCYHHLSTYIDIDRIAEARKSSEQELAKLDNENDSEE